MAGRRTRPAKEHGEPERAVGAKRAVEGLGPGADAPGPSGDANRPGGETAPTAEARRPVRAGRTADAYRVDDDTLRTLRELSFLHEFAQLATQARDWDELMRTIVDRTTRGAPRGGLLVLPPRPGNRPAHARGDERPGPRPGRPGQPVRRRGRHRRRGGRAQADRGAGRAARSPLQVPSRLRPRRAHLDALRPAHLERPGRRRPERPDGRDPPVHPARGQPPRPRSPRSWPGSSRRAASSASRSSSSRR